MCMYAYVSVCLTFFFNIVESFETIRCTVACCNTTTWPT